MAIFLANQDRDTRIVPEPYGCHFFFRLELEQFNLEFGGEVFEVSALCVRMAT